MKLLIPLFFLFSFFSTSAQVKLPAMVRDSMIMQRDAPVKIWGWASPGEKVKVVFQNKKLVTTAAKDSSWNITLPPMKAGGPYIMNITGRNSITLKEIWMGDVWLCAGQSNMVHQLALHSERYRDDIASTNNPLIRQFWVPNNTSLSGPQSNLPAGYWKSATGQDVLPFSAVAYFFAKKIFDKYHVPVGIINASVGGTPIEAWTSEEGLKEFPGVTNLVQKNKDTAYVNGLNRAAFAANAAKPKPIDRGLQNNKPWYDTSYTPQDWRRIMLPGYWEDQGIRNLDGIVWYRKEVVIPASMDGKRAKIALGRIIDADFVYINGTLVGTTSYQYPQRRYTIPDGVLKKGKNTMVVRVINNAGKGGFVPDKPYYITAGNDTVDLRGEWQYKVGAAFTPQKSVAGISLQNQPTALFNAMIAPLTNYSMKGFAWYQGESNVGNASEYQKLLAALIKDWRKHWQWENLPALFVQLPNYDDVQYLPTESPWAVLREGERKTLSLPNTAMVVAIDVGEWNDIHPDRKKEVGERLALQAMRLAYGEKALVASGPLFQSVQRNGDTLVLSFSDVGSGLTTTGEDTLDEFAIAGSDKKFVWAKAKIVGDKVLVWHEDVPVPMYIRYAWADNPAHPNLYNREGLPASPFEATTKQE